MGSAKRRENQHNVLLNKYVTYPGSQVIGQVPSGEISTSFRRQFVSVLHFIQLNVFGDEFSVLSGVSTLTHHGHNHFVGQLKGFVIVYNEQKKVKPRCLFLTWTFLPSFMTMMLRALVLSMATMAKSLKHKAREHSILFLQFSKKSEISVQNMTWLFLVQSWKYWSETKTSGENI